MVKKVKRRKSGYYGEQKILMTKTLKSICLYSAVGINGSGATNIAISRCFLSAQCFTTCASQNYSRTCRGELYMESIARFTIFHTLVQNQGHPRSTVCTVHSPAVFLPKISLDHLIFFVVHYHNTSIR